jgi:hypothetical protein
MRYWICAMQRAERQRQRRVATVGNGRPAAGVMRLRRREGRRSDGLAFAFAFAEPFRPFHSSRVFVESWLAWASSVLALFSLF